MCGRPRRLSRNLHVEDYCREVLGLYLERPFRNPSRPDELRGRFGYSDLKEAAPGDGSLWDLNGTDRRPGVYEPAVLDWGHCWLGRSTRNSSACGCRAAVERIN